MTLPFVELCKRGVSVVVLGVSCVRCIRQGISLRYNISAQLSFLLVDPYRDRRIAVVWLLPTLDTIWNSTLEAKDSLMFRSMSDVHSSPRSVSEGKRVSFGTPANAPARNTGTALDLLVPGHLTPTLLDNPQLTPDNLLMGTSLEGGDAPLIALLRARLKELESTLSLLESRASTREMRSLSTFSDKMECRSTC
jgi:hypothetical protein